LTRVTLMAEKEWRRLKRISNKITVIQYQAQGNLATE
jgi:hypothetical protein